MNPWGTVIALLALLVAPAAAQEVAVDDFERDEPTGWQISGSPEYYKGGFGAKGLSIVRDAEAGSRVLRAEIRFADVKASEPLFITKSFTDGPAIRSLARVRFRYKLTTTALDPAKPFVVRLRTSPTTFTDHPVAAQKDLVANRWQTVDLDVSRPPRLVNVYNTLFTDGVASRLMELTFRLDDQDDANVEGALLVDDIRFVTKAEEAMSYTPRVTPRQGGKLRRALVVRQSAAGYYGIERALRNLPEPPQVETRLFRGLHFPIFNFPESRDALFAYDLVALADVDPYVLTADQVRWLCDYAASGGGLLFCDGPNTFGSAKRFPEPLAALLPVTFRPESPMLGINAAVEHGVDHAITRGLPDAWGRITRAHALQARPGAKVLLRAGREVPRDWGVYSGGTRDNISLEADAGHNGGRSAAMLLRNFYVDPKTGKPAWIQATLLSAPTDGYTGANALPARPSTRYRFSFRIRGDVPSVTVQVRSWKSEAAPPADREYLETSVKTVRPEAEWRQYEGEFTTTAATKRFALEWHVGGNPSTLALGQRFCVDDVVLAEAREGAPNLVTNPGAEETLATPVLAIGTAQRGRVMTIAGFPDVLETRQGSFFTGDHADDLLRQAARWLARIDTASLFATFTPPPAEVARGAAVTLSGAVTPGGKAAAVRCRVRHLAPPGPPNIGGVGGGGVVLLDAKQPLSGAKREFAFRTAAGSDASADGSYACDVEVLDARGRVLDRRDGGFRVVGPLPGSIAFPYGKAVFVPGRPLAFSVRLGEEEKPLPEGLTVRARLLDFRGAAVHAFPERPAAGSVDYQFQAPEWESGLYKVEAEVVGSRGALLRLKAPFRIVDPLDMGRFFPVMSILGTDGGGQMLDEAGVRARVDDLIAHGFNTIAMTGNRDFAKPSLSHRAEIRNAAEAYAQARNMAVIFEYENYQRVGRQEKTQPCVFSPEYPAALAGHLESVTRVASSVPRLISVKITDEPFASPANMDYCEHCRRAYKERYGFELRPPDQIPDDAPAERLALTRFVSDYVSEGYHHSRAYHQAAKAPFGLLLTYCAPAYGYAVARKNLEDAFAWSRYADLIDFDVYPYFYPVSDRVRMLQVHYSFAVHRAIARHLGKPMGFYFELDDRNYPFQINPVEASGECAFTALAQGADYLNSFINTAFSTGTQSRPERWAHLGRELKKVQAAAPLLKVTARPAAPVALYFPRAQWLSGDQRCAPDYAYQLLLRAFGEADVIDEDVVREKGLGPVRALFLLDTEVLPDDVADKLAAFVRGGGLLACDRIPERNERGEPCRLPKELFAEARLPAAASPMPVAKAVVGSGQVWLFASSLNEAFRGAAEGPDEVVARALMGIIAKGLQEAGVHSRIHSADPEVEAGLRLGRDTALLVVVSHRAEAAKTRITLGAPGFTPAYAADVATGQAIPLREEAGQRPVWSLEVSLPARTGQLIALWPARPAGVRVTAPAGAKRGAALSYRIEVLDAAGKPAKGRHALAVSVIDPEGKERPRYGGAAATTDGVWQMRVPLAANAAPGKWRIRARETGSGKSAEASFQVP